MLDGGSNKNWPTPRPGPMTGEVDVSDDALLAQIAAGDIGAWGTIVDRHLPAVSRYAASVLGDNAQGEDVAQETFIRLMTKAQTWEANGAGLKSWLFRVARNLCIDHKRKKRPEPIGNAEFIGDPVDGDATNRRIDIANTVKLALAELPERQQTAIVLVHYEGFSGSEAANLLDISVEAVESLLARARRSLRMALKPDAAELLGER